MKNLEITFTQRMNENRQRVLYNQFTKRLECVSGLTMSVQASEGHYCSPRSNNVDYAFYDTFEIGYPSEVVSKLIPFAEDSEYLTSTVYPQVPKELIQEIINDNGGLVCTSITEN